VPDGVDLDEVAARAVYVGSPEHKNVPSFAGPPKLRADASCCPRDLATKQALVTDWLKEAIRRGATGGYWEGYFPRYVWFMHGQTVFEGRLVNREAGWYKGYPLNHGEWPEGLRDIYE
jgi:hypothetical protein